MNIDQLMAQFAPLLQEQEDRRAWMQFASAVMHNMPAPLFCSKQEQQDIALTAANQADAMMLEYKKRFAMPIKDCAICHAVGKHHVGCPVGDPRNKDMVCDSCGVAMGESHIPGCPGLTQSFITRWVKRESS